MKRIFLLLISVCATGVLLAQEQNLLVNFNGQQIENYIHLSFTVRGGVTCSATKVERGDDSIHFETIGEIPGVCGSSSSDEAYFFDDSTPAANTLNYYRINFGNLGVSQSIKLKFTDYGNDFVIVSNPVLHSATIYFSNFNGEVFTLSIYDLNGILRKQLITRSNSVTLETNSLPPGICFVQLFRQSELLQVKKVIFQ